MSYNFSDFCCCNFVYFKSIWEKICIFPPFFIYVNHFFPQHVIWPYLCPGGGRSNRKIYTLETLYTHAFFTVDLSLSIFCVNGIKSKISPVRHTGILNKNKIKKKSLSLFRLFQA